MDVEKGEPPLDNEVFLSYYVEYFPFSGRPAHPSSRDPSSRKSSSREPSSRSSCPPVPVN